MYCLITGFMHTLNQMQLETIFKSSFNWTNLGFKMRQTWTGTVLSLMHKFHYAKCCVIKCLGFMQHKASHRLYMHTMIVGL